MTGDFQTKTPVWPRQRDAAIFYGNPSVDNAKWQAANLVKVIPPFQLYYSDAPVKAVRIHRKCAQSFTLIMLALWEYYEHSQIQCEKAGITVYDGIYAYRPVRKGTALSMHAYGCAIDFNAARNGQTFNRTAGLFKPNSPIVSMFKQEGWIWGGDWKGKRDPMHFQAARVA